MNEEIPAPARVAALVPLAADRPVIRAQIELCGLEPCVCETPAALEVELQRAGLDGVLFVLVTEEAAGARTAQIIRAALEDAPAWASLPVICLIDRPDNLPPACHELQQAAKISTVVLTRPVAPGLLRSIMSIQAEARGRQFEMRDLLGSLEESRDKHAFLLDELRHRTRNSLAILRGLFELTTRRHTTLESFTKAFSERLGALVTAHGHLTEDTGGSDQLKSLLQQHILPYSADHAQIRLEGPAVRLSQRLTFDLGLMIHELSTNAAKYGALSSPEGRVAVRWQLDGTSGELDLVWEERDGPQVSEPEEAGLGSELLERLAQANGVEAKLDYRPEGLVWSARFPAGEVRAS